MTEFIGTLDPARVSVIILMRCGKPFYTVSLLTVSATVYVLFCVMSHFSTLMASVFIFPHTHTQLCAQPLLSISPLGFHMDRQKNMQEKESD